jgi:tetratricopeptide (TPR) repeat protein
LSSTWSALTTQEAVRFEEGYDRTEAAALHALDLDSLQGTALANLAFVRAQRSRSLSVGMELIDRAVAVDPSNAEVFLVKSALYRHAGLWDQAIDAIRVGHQLDPLAPYYLEREATIELCAGRPATALKLAESELTMIPNDAAAQNARVRSLVWLGRYDEAIAAWRQQALSNSNAALAEQLAGARGSAGYWAATHLVGQQRLSVLERKGKRGWVSPRVIMRAQFAAGDTTAAFDALTRAASEREPSLFRMACNPDFDEVRETPHFVALQKQVGFLPP